MPVDYIVLIESRKQFGDACVYHAIQISTESIHSILYHNFILLIFIIIARASFVLFACFFVWGYVVALHTPSLTSSAAANLAVDVAPTKECGTHKLAVPALMRTR